MKRAFYVLATLAVLTLFTLNRPYIYKGFQDAGLKIGLNFNNIATSSYVEFINSQPDDFTDYKEAIFLNKNVQFKDISSQIASNIILGESTQQKVKSIDINLTDQRLYIKEGDIIVGNYLISSGKWAATPTGSWPIWTKLRYSGMKGGSRAFNTYYNLPNVPYVMYFNKGYAIHGAYWHNVFGQPMSHGSVNMKPEEAGVVYDWAEVGNIVTIHY